MYEERQLQQDIEAMYNHFFLQEQEAQDHENN